MFRELQSQQARVHCPTAGHLSSRMTDRVVRKDYFAYSFCLVSKSVGNLRLTRL